jgi:nitroreductase
LAAEREKDGMDSMIEAIRQRISVRTYLERPIDEDKKQAVVDLLRANTEGPFGQTVRLALIDFAEMEREEVKRLGTYGVIRGARLYIVSAVKEGRGAMEDLGYCFEKVILGATSLGLGTCWMGGTFRRSSFAKRIGASEGQIVPAVSPIGYAGDGKSVAEVLLRRFAGSDGRKPWRELFFDGGMATPLAKEAAGSYATALECVRLGPSASNNQPWRVLRQGDGIFHFYLKRTPGYDKLMRSVDLQLVDMGIALSHFELAARETGLAGGWMQSAPDLEVGSLRYILSWRAS